MFIPRKLYGVIGDPIEQSLSPVLHNTGFQTWKIPAALLSWRITPDKLAAFVDAARTLPVEGACVTLPHKEKIIPFLDRLTPLASRVGAVNTLYWEGDELVGHNTDVEGFLSPLFLRPVFPTALILGAGGAARAVLAGLQELTGVKKILLSARREEQARELAAEIKAPSPDHHDDGDGEIQRLAHEKNTCKTPAIEIVPWDMRNEIEANLVVNTTPVGMAGGNTPAASPLTRFPKPKEGERPCAYDLIYQKTPFLAAARAAGWNTLTGRDMFAVQGTAQFMLWTGFPLPDAAFAALDDAIRTAEEQKTTA